MRSLAWARVLSRCESALHRALVDAEEVDAARERVGARLEDVGVGLAVLGRLERHVGQLEAAVLDRRGQVVDERVEQPVGAQVRGRDAAGDREDVALVGAVLERGDDLLVRDLLALEVALHQRVGVLGDLVHQLLAVLLAPARAARPGSGSRGSSPCRSPCTRRPSCRRGRSGRASRAPSRSGSRWPPRGGRRRS